MDIIEIPTFRQVGLLSHLMSEHRDWLPNDWRNRVGYRDGLADWRLYNFEKWAGALITKQVASALIATLTEENYEGAREILKNNGL